MALSLLEAAFDQKNSLHYNVYQVYKPHKLFGARSKMEERQIGTTEMRQKLTDVIEAGKEEKVAYVVETFGRPQVAMISIEEYRRWQVTNQVDAQTRESARSAFGMWAERPDLDDEWLQRNREQWYSAWVKDERNDE